MTYDSKSNGSACLMSGVWVAIQLILVFPLTFAVCLLPLKLSNSFLLTGNHQSGWAHKEALLFLIVGSGFGFMVAAEKPELRWSAMMACVIPLFLLALEISSEFKTGHSPFTSYCIIRLAMKVLHCCL